MIIKLERRWGGKTGKDDECGRTQSKIKQLCICMPYTLNSTYIGNYSVYSSAQFHSCSLSQDHKMKTHKTFHKLPSFFVFICFTLQEIMRIWQANNAQQFNMLTWCFDAWILPRISKIWNRKSPTTKVSSHNKIKRKKKRGMSKN